MAKTMQALNEPVLVTGAAGFVGRRLVHRLLDDNVSVVALDIAACPESLQNNVKLTWLPSDIASKSLVREAVERSATVFHLAAVVSDWGDPAWHQSVTVGGTRNVLEAVAECGAKARVVLASSIVVYGDQLNGQRCHEGLPTGKSLGSYSECKLAQEALARQFIQQGQDIRIVRPANIYGAGSKPWVDDVCVELLRGLPVLINGGRFDAGLVHVDNVVDILLRAGRCREGSGQIYNAADEEGITWKQYMTDLAEACGAPKPRSMPNMVAEWLALAAEKSFRLLKVRSRPPLTREALNLVGSSHYIDMSKTKADLGYKQVKHYAAGIEEIRQYLSR